MFREWACQASTPCTLPPLADSPCVCLLCPQVYAELDEQLQTDFSAYLAERGVTEDLGAYLLQLMHDKEQR